ncbi:polysaccharide deacetylase family protein [Megalodesulfovibrio gigas]|uniref:Putative polysaccharide deacetylase n=1 Tax=Megalodesulfovibrio gigas (strain ATCC 19364 / DSM 1382 / NCIMB 9332 / VKM B-1759) TaxID=1121448 RepID=T2GBA2_MEGG1|nr:polysaccharide deacetylase family protein [Megalodesulfovibrio gigas]AGW13870.1 putative polysaccharide deacetylase [Megalodesulfovibrio gigas DSM 1382 = ATCC 19364]
MTISFKRRLKLLGAAALTRLGMPRLARRGQTLLVLCYHRVVPEDQAAAVLSSPYIVVREDSFARQMALLAAECAVVPLEDGLDLLARGQLPRRAVAITFDDGWKDTRTTALPILERHGLPALVYLTTGVIGTGRLFWQERLTHALRLLQAVDGSRNAPPPLPPDLAGLWQRAHHNGVLDSHRLTRLLKQSTPDAGERLATALLDGLGHPALPPEVHAANAMLDWDDVHAMQRRGVAFGSHTVDHVLLPAATPEVRAAQLEESRRVLRQRLGQEVRALAYPNGDHSLAVRRAAMAAGYTSAATLERGFNDESLDCLRVRRVNVYEGKTAGPRGFSPDLFRFILTAAL